jgi:AcrR family transcriptional regulator
MAPRGYTLKRRAETAAATRARILDATIALYLERGVTSTSIHAVAERADVARGTVVNHFGGTDGLLEAVLDRAAEEVEIPDPSQIAGARSLEERIRRFVDLTFRFFERGTDWWLIFYAELDLPAVKARERQYNDLSAAFYGAAFGEVAADVQVAAAVRAFVDYGPLNALRSSGLSLDESVDVVADALVNLARRRIQPPDGSPA